MSLSDLVNNAKEIAKQAHAGQTDKAGKPYIEHPASVASMVETDEEKIVAWLHDVLEDTSVSAKCLADVFPARIMAALDALTHMENERYEEYVERIRLNPLAVKVKMADLVHNMDLTRLREPTGKDLQRVKKYELAYEKLLAGTSVVNTQDREYRN